MFALLGMGPMNPESRFGLGELRPIYHVSPQREGIINMTDTTTAGVATGALAELLKANCEQTVKACEACPEGKRLYQLADGKATPLWLLGHMANLANLVGVTMGLGKESLFPADWGAKFNPTQFGGSPITSNADDYPGWDELLEKYKAVMTTLAEGTAELEDAQLTGDCLGTVPPPLAEMVPNLKAAIVMHLIHDSHHRGQIALLAAT